MCEVNSSFVSLLVNVEGIKHISWQWRRVELRLGRERLRLLVDRDKLHGEVDVESLLRSLICLRELPWTTFELELEMIATYFFFSVVNKIFSMTY